MMLRKFREDGTDPNLALLCYRNMEIKGMMYSHAQMLFNRRLRDNLPMKDSLLKPQMSVNVKQQLANRQSKQPAYYNKSSKPCNEFKRGETMRAKVDTGREWIPAVIDDIQCTSRIYIVITEKGQTIKRNNSAIRSSHETVRVNSLYPDLSKSLPVTELAGSSQQITPIEDIYSDKCKFFYAA